VFSPLGVLVSKPVLIEPSIVKAQAARKRNAALRAAGDPAVLDKAARVVRAGLQLGKLTADDLTGPIVRAGR
jgi:hypothetical protein